MKPLRSSLFALMLGAAIPVHLIVPAHAQVAIDVSVDIAPPPLPYYEQPIIPAEGYIWVPGYWAWDPNEADYYWVPGTWVEPPQPELLWTPAYWGWVGGRYMFHPGYWGREVGFYGGIDYGYGYGGEGYYGGRWDHGVFFYNRTVNNVTNVRITNVYNQTVVVNNAANRVSFNGGTGGTTVRPTPQQEAIARERHVEATSMQRQHVEAASKDRALFAKQNHGEPAVAATPRAGTLQGEGVTRASRTPVGPAPVSGREPGQQPTPQGHELPRPGQDVPRPAEAGKELPKAEGRPPAEEHRLPQGAPKGEPARPAEINREPSRPAEVNREPSRVEPRSEPRVEPRPAPKVEERPMAPAPRVEERRPPSPPPQAARPPAEPPRMAPPPRPAAPPPHPPAREEEKR